MNGTISSPSTRSTLKLKVGARRRMEATNTPPVSPPDIRAKLKPSAHWSDEYKGRMQAEMDALATR